MSKSKLNGDSHSDDEHVAHASEAHETEGADFANGAAASESTRDKVIATAATVGVVAVGAVIFEAALIPGLVLVVAAALAPQFAPKAGSVLAPIFRSTVRGVYRLGQKSREVFAEAQEHMSDIAAEVSAEDQAKGEAKAAAPATEPHAAAI